MANLPQHRKGPRAALGLVLLATLAVACGLPRADTVVVAGKTVYRGMAVEEVELEVFSAGADGLQPVARGRSGYHGSFALRLAPGTYRVAAKGRLPGPLGTDLALVASQTLEVAPGAGRIDRWVVELQQAEAP